MQDTKIKHLEFIQTTLGRMANCSFLLKGWTVTIVGALLALSLKESEVKYNCISMIVLIVFALLDSFYLYNERLFRALFNKVRISEKDLKFDMSIKPFKEEVKWLATFFSFSIFVFYGSLILIQILIINIK